MKYILAFSFALLFSVLMFSQTKVSNTSYTTKSNEKVLRLEMVLDHPINKVWDAFTTIEGINGWIAPVAKLDLRYGGAMYTNYDKNKSIGDSGTIELGIINYIENELLTYKVNFNEGFSKKLQDEDINLQEIVQFKDLGNGKTKLVSSMVGWGNGDDWNKIYGFFTEGNKWTYEQLIKYLDKK